MCKKRQEETVVEFYCSEIIKRKIKLSFALFLIRHGCFWNALLIFHER